MMTWSNPAALSALALLAGPILVHLLRRHRARRVLFPSVRFVQTSRTAAARFRMPSDAPLLLLRLVIVGLAVAALAQPLAITPGRVAEWNRRVATAIVVDVSPSMNTAATAVAEVIAAETESSTFAYRIDSARLETGLERAVDIMKTAPPARRHIVVVSDFQIGALNPGDLERIPRDIGLRFVQTGSPAPERVVAGIDLLTSAGVARQRVVLSAEATRVRSTDDHPAAAAGLELMASPGEARDVERLRRAVTQAGTPAPSSDQRITVAFAGAAPVAVRPVSAGWMLDTSLRLRHDAELRSACNESRAFGGVRDSAAWFTLCVDAEGRPLVRAAGTGNSLLIHVAAPPSAFVSAAAVRGALVARLGTAALPEEEVRRMSSTELAGLARVAAPITPNIRDTSLPSDARWWWAIVLVLLGLESVARRARHDTTEARSHAA
jgi:hypothetical protein